MTTTLTPATTSPTPPRQPLTPARRVTFVVGALITAMSIAYGVAVVIAEGSEATERTSFTIIPVGSTFTVETEAGDITIVPSGDNRVHVVRVARFGGRKPVFDEVQDGTGNRLSASCSSHWFMSECSVDYQVAVPAGLDVRLRSDVGDVRASNIEGGVEATTSTGDIEVRGVDGALRLRSSTGDVSAEGVRSDDVNASSSTGDVTLLFLDAPDTVSAVTDTGDVRVLLPSGPYRTTTDSDAGDITVDIETSPTAQRTVEAHTNTGDVELLRAG